MTYGVQPTGFVRKPLAVIKAELEQAFITEFGPQIIMTAESPAGQLIGLLSDAIAEEWEHAENIYQSHDVDQAEGVRLDQLGRYRLVERALDDDPTYRRRITNQGEARVDIQDITNALCNIDGVSYVRVWLNGDDQVNKWGMPTGSVAIAILGGEEGQIADMARAFIAPGIVSFGNHQVESLIDGFCRSTNIIRPIIVPVTLTVQVRLFNDRQNCPPPAPAAIQNGLVADWVMYRDNGLDVDFFTVRQLIESRHQGVEVIRIQASRDGNPALPSAMIGFIEIAELTAANITIEVE